MTSIAIGAFAIAAMGSIAAAEQLPVPLNEIMPRLPPVPEPPRQEQPLGPCRLSSNTIPLGDVTPATVAQQTPDGIALSGSAADAGLAGAEESSLCPIQPD